MSQSSVKAAEARMFWITSSDARAELRSEAPDVGVMLDELDTLTDYSDWPLLRERAARARADIASLATPELETGTGA